MSRSSQALLVAALLLVPGGSEASCPSAERVLEALARVRELAGTPIPDSRAAIDEARLGLAAAEPGRPVTVRVGDDAAGLVLAPLPVDRLWRAVNDSEHHPGLMPIRASTVLDGTPRGTERRIFQYFRRWGVGRWWVNRVTMNAALFERSEGAVWELRWRDEIRPADAEHPTVRAIADDVRPIDSSRGSWRMTALDERCTIVEFATRSEPGGALGVLQRPFVRRAVAETLLSLLEMADGHVGLPHPGPPFVAPDGRPLD